jgi:predicted phage tail protein
LKRREIKGEKGCFARGSLVMMADKTEVNIECLQIGDKLLGFEPNGELCETTVQEIRKHENEKAWEFRFWNSTVTCTSNHWILNQFNSFVEIASLTCEDAAVNVNGHLEPLYRDLSLGLDTDVFSIITTNHTLIVNKLRFHNGGLGLEPHLAGKKGGGKGGGGGQARTPVENPNNLQSKNIARIIDLISEGPIKGLVDGFKSIYLDDTPIQNDDDSYNFQGFEIEGRLGYPDQDFLAGFKQAEAEISVGTELLFGSPVVRTISDPDLDALIVKIQIPNLSTVNLTTGDTTGGSVTIKIELRENAGVYETIIQDTISGKTTSPYERSYRIPLNYNTQPWDLRVSRLTADSFVQTTQNKTYFSSYTKVTDVKLTYPDCAVVGVVADAEQFGSRIPSRSYEVYGLIVNIPSNYNPTTRVYTGIWDGTFKLAWTDNPAWVFYDLLVNRRYGLGEEVSGYFVDKWSIYEIGKYCDGLVPDGQGGFEPRFRFNGVINSRSEAYRVLNTIASAFLSMIYWGAGVVTLAQDSPSDPVKLVSPANVIDGLFNYSGSSLKSRSTVALVTWNDPADAYRASVEVVEDPEGIRRYGFRPTDVAAFGCTSRSQAQRYGKWILDTNKFATETVSYKCSFDHMDLRPGEIIAIADPAYAGARLGGRIKTATTTVLELDLVPTETAGEAHYIWCTLPNGDVVQKQILSFAGNTVTLDSALSSAPLVGSMWVLGAASVNPRQFRVVSVTETDKNIYEVTAIQHDETKYDRVESNISTPTEEFSILPSGKLGKPLNISIQEYLYKVGLGAKAAFDISVSPTSDPRAKFYEVQILRPGDTDYKTISLSSIFSVKVEDTINGTYGVRARSVSSFGLRSEWLQKSFIVVALLAPPKNVTELRVTVNSNQLFMDWDAVPDLDLAFYEIKYTPESSGAAWGSSQLLRQTTGTSLTVPAANGSYLIKAVDTSGVYSLMETVSVVGVVDLLNKNIVEEVLESPTWIGTKTNVEVNSVNLTLSSTTMLSEWTTINSITNIGYDYDGVYLTGEYIAAETVDMGEIYTCTISSDIRAFGNNLTTKIGDWPILSNILELGESVDPASWTVELQIRKSNDNITWTPWEKFYIGEHSARAFQFKLLLTSLDKRITPVVTKFLVTVDMPDRVYSGQDLVCPPGGLSVVYLPSFAAKPAVAVNVQGVTGGEYNTITSATETGFTIQFFSNDTNTAVTRTFDYVAHGYGRKIG